MKNILKYFLFGILGIGVIYLLWIAFVPMMIGSKIIEREIIQQSPQYVISQRSAILKLYPQYLQSEGGVQEAIRSQMCEIANNIPRTEWPNQIKGVCN